jgi:hypothetical protein
MMPKSMAAARGTPDLAAEGDAMFKRAPRAHLLRELRRILDSCDNDLEFVIEALIIARTMQSGE